MSNYCNGTCPMYDAENGECCATDEPRVSVKPDAECFFDVYDHDHPYVEPTPTNADRIRSMSDEELAKIITSDLIGELIPFCQNKHECDAMLTINTIPEEWCMKCALDWLKEEHHETD